MNNLKVGQVKMVRIGRLSPAPFDPEIRRDDKYTKNLVQSMKEYGFWLDKPITITKDYVIADGHRRWTVAKKLGIREVPCIVTHLDIETAWAQGMATTRPISAKEVFQAYSKGLREIPNNATGGTIKSIKNKYGEDLILYLAEHGLSTSPVMYAERTCSYIGWEKSVENIRKVVLWIVEHKLTRQILYFISEGVLQIPREDLVTLIDKNEVPQFRSQAT